MKSTAFVGFLTSHVVFVLPFEIPKTPSLATRFGRDYLSIGRSSVKLNRGKGDETPSVSHDGFGRQNFEKGFHVALISCISWLYIEILA
jgi:hypothetical protein